MALKHFQGWVACASGLAIMGALVLSDPVGATFPGENGKLAFESDRDGNLEIYTMNPDGSGQTRLTNNNAIDRQPAWSPSGTKIAFASHRSGEGDIYTMNPDGSGLKRLTNNGATDGYPLWSPDGTKIAFGRVISDTDLEVITMNSDGSNETNVTNSGTWDYVQNWSPDSTKIAYTELDMVGSGGSNIWVTDLEGSNQEQLTTDGTSFNPFWSPDGSQISYVSYLDGDNEIYIMDSDGTDETQLTNNTASDTAQSWSPDGTKLGFRSLRDGNSEVYTMDRDGTDQTRLTNNTALDHSVRWSPDGNQLVFRGGLEGNGEIYRVNAIGGPQTQLTNNNFDDMEVEWGVLDVVPPTTSLVGAPNATTTDRTPTFRFRSNEGGSSFTCKLDSGSFRRCTSPKTYAQPLARGSHTFKVRARDVAGNLDPTPAVHSWRIIRP